MASFGNTLIGGTGYSIIGGNDLIGGTAYEIIGGKTLIGGTAYDIGDSSGSSSGGYVTLQITDGFYPTSGTASLYCQAYVLYDNIRYTSGTISVPVGSIIKIYRKRGPKSQESLISTSYDVAYRYYEDTTLKQTSAYTTSSTIISTTLEITTNTKISFLYKSVSSGGGSGEIM